jgi:hypothetical protein
MNTLLVGRLARNAPLWSRGALDGLPWIQFPLLALLIHFTIPTTLAPFNRCGSDTLFSHSAQYAQVAVLPPIPCHPWDSAKWIAGRVPRIAITSTAQLPGTSFWCTLGDTLVPGTAIFARTANPAGLAPCWSNVVGVP